MKTFWCEDVLAGKYLAYKFRSGKIDSDRKEKKMNFASKKDEFCMKLFITNNTT